MVRLFWIGSLTLLSAAGVATYFWLPAAFFYIFLVPVIAVGIRDTLQTHHAVLRNFPVIGHFRYLLEEIRPEIQQYFIESDNDGKPFSREKRSIIYQRSKGALDTLPFGTKQDVYAVGYEWINHSIAAKSPKKELPRMVVGGPACKHPYNASLLNVSAMSFGALSKNAVLALNGGAKKGNFAHNTGEGGLSPYHLQPGGDIIWQIGTGYFSARNKDGRFDPVQFRERALLPQVKMIELKLSQGAKPGHGGILPARKLTPEIAQIRGVEMGKDVLSPPYHTEFTTPTGMLEFIARLREGCNAKPVGFKLCVGSPPEVFAICKAMLKTGIYPDFITVDGGEGGTGAAPLEFSNWVGTPLVDALILVHDALMGCGLRDKIKIIASGHSSTGFHIAQRLALGADMVNCARAMMFALGCIQALRCNTNRCPVGVATQDPALVRGLVVDDKSERVYHFHRETLHSLNEIVGAMGRESPDEIRRWDVLRRVDPINVKSYAELFPYPEFGSFAKDKVPERYQRAWNVASADSFVVARKTAA